MARGSVPVGVGRRETPCGAVLGPVRAAEAVTSGRSRLVLVVVECGWRTRRPVRRSALESGSETGGRGRVGAPSDGRWGGGAGELGGAASEGEGARGAGRRRVGVERAVERAWRGRADAGGARYERVDDGAGGGALLALRLVGGEPSASSSLSCSSGGPQPGSTLPPPALPPPTLSIVVAELCRRPYRRPPPLSAIEDADHPKPSRSSAGDVAGVSSERSKSSSASESDVDDEGELVDEVVRLRRVVVGEEGRKDERRVSL